MSASPDLEAARSSQRPERGPIQSQNMRSHPNSRDPAVITSKYGDTSAAYWKLYMSEAKINDQKFIESLKRDTESMVFLNTLFSAIIASFIIDIYKTLLPDRGQRTVDLLSQLVSQSSTSRSPPPTSPDDQSFHPPSITIRINVVLFLSFFLSMMSAVGCALIQQWCHEYMKNAYPPGAPYERGHIRTYLFQGLTKFKMRRFMNGTHVLLHISVFLFFWAISDFFYTVHPAVGAVSRYCLVASLVVYMVLSILPFIFANSPYNTPLTHPLGFFGIHLRHCYRNVLWCLKHWRDAGKRSHNPHTKKIRFDRARLISDRAKKQVIALESDAMRWLFKDNDFSDKDMDKFLEGLPGYISSHQPEEHQVNNCIAADYILGRIREHFLTCAMSGELSEEDSISRVLSCVNSVRLIFQHGTTHVENSSETGNNPSEADDNPSEADNNPSEVDDNPSEADDNPSEVDDNPSEADDNPSEADDNPSEVDNNLSGADNNPSEADNGTIRRQMTYIDDIMKQLRTLCAKTTHPIVALGASCVRAIAVQGLLTHFAHSEGGTMPNRSFPHPLIPLFTFFFPNDHRDTIKRLLNGHITNDETKTIWKVLLSDGPLINLKKLAEVILSREDAPSSSLSLCLKALERLVKQLGVGFTNVSKKTERQFNSVRDRTKKYVETTEQGFRISPLLDILDVVIRGRRLALVFSSHPEYHNRADLVFGEEHLRNAGLLESFASCLPDYIASIPEKRRRKFMEDLVCEDHLWTSLQVNLWNAQRSDRPTPDKLRVFEDCLTVLDVAFSSLEDSTKVNWRAPEFGSLSHRFESFITDCFKDSFMGRATSFRVGMIKVRCYKVLLAQFCRDFHHDTIFRSQWDIASLTRLFCGLGIGDKKDAKIWKSYVNGGHIGPEFTAKARETIARAECDGPLLVFYKLGYLATTAVPLDGSGLDPKDLEKVWELLRNMIENDRLALNRASLQVWEKLGALRAEVSHLCDKLSSEDRDKLQPLLDMMDVVHTPASNELSSSSTEHAFAEGAVSPTSLLRKQRGSMSLSSLSDTTAVTGGQSGATTTSEDKFGESSADTVFDLEKNTKVPLSSIYDEPPIIGPIPLSVAPVDPYFSYTGDTDQSHTLPNEPHMRRSASSSGLGATWQSPATRMGSTRPKPRKTVTMPMPIIPPGPAISSAHRPSDVSDPGQSGTSPNPNSEVGEDE